MLKAWTQTFDFTVFGFDEMSAWSAWLDRHSDRCYVASTGKRSFGRWAFSRVAG